MVAVTDFTVRRALLPLVNPRGITKEKLEKAVAEADEDALFSVVVSASELKLAREVYLAAEDR